MWEFGGTIFSKQGRQYLYVKMKQKKNAWLN